MTTTFPVTSTVADLGEAFHLEDEQGVEVAFTVSLDEGRPDSDHGTTVVLTPTECPEPGELLHLDLEPGRLVDTWGNPLLGASFVLAFLAGLSPAVPPPVLGTATAPVARSVVGNAVLFQSHLYDYDTGLYLARARVFDPYTGMFL